MEQSVTMTSLTSFMGNRLLYPPQTDHCQKRYPMDFKGKMKYILFLNFPYKGGWRVHGDVVNNTVDHFCGKQTQTTFHEQAIA